MGEDGLPRLLLIDDEAQILSALTRSLRREGYELLTAKTPREALRILEDSPVDLILADHKMPGMSGLDLLGRAADLQPAAVRMLITGWSGSVTQKELEDIGIAAVIPKPWEDAELKASIREALSPTDGS